jgi:deoxyribodipyrimidine photolyase-related protein
MSQSAWLVLGNQLYDPKFLKSQKTRLVFMAEDEGLCTYYQFHKQKILFFLLSMRAYRDELKQSGFDIEYLALDDRDNRSEQSYENKLKNFLKKFQITELHIFEIEDKFFESRIHHFSKKEGISLKTHQSPGFLFSRGEFTDYLNSNRKPFLKTFYEAKRKETGILMTPEGKPVGGRFSFDAENRKKLPRNIDFPKRKDAQKSKEFENVLAVVNSRFGHHPGDTETWIWPTSREEAKKKCHEFVENCLSQFGVYQDAIDSRNDFNFHSLLSPLINVGWINPRELMEFIESSTQAPLNSREGFVRQVMGWREFIRGIYQNFSQRQETSNFFGHERRLKRIWYEAKTGLEFLDHSLARTWRFAYNHHIERLMIISNVMLMCEIQPREVHRWFMEMYVDSSDWVMGPNVYGMGQFSDGGLFATKPYIGASNYILKMSHYKKGDWCDIMDGLFWRFLDKHRNFFSKQYRMAGLLKNLEKMPKSRKQMIFEEAENFIQKVSFS